MVNGLDLALEAGNVRTANTVLLGALANLLDPTVEQWHQALRNMVPPKLLEVNLKAFELGRAA